MNKLVLGGLAAAAVFAIGGTSGAVAATLITSADIKDDTIRTGDIRDDTVRSRDVRDWSLRLRDLNPDTREQLMSDLPEDTVARIDVTEKGVRVNLREGMPGKDFAAMLRTLADAFEDGSIKRTE